MKGHETCFLVPYCLKPYKEVLHNHLHSGDYCHNRHYTHCHHHDAILEVNDDGKSTEHTCDAQDGPMSNQAFLGVLDFTTRINK